MNKKKILKRILIIIISLFSIEYISFGTFLSVFRLMIFPLSFVGLVILKPSFKKSQKTFFLIFILSLLFNILSAANSDNFINGLLNSLGIFIFVFFILSYFEVFGITKRLLRVLALFSAPHYLAFLLWFFFSFEIFATRNGRFFGFHIDPNFMSMYINIALITKLNYLVIYKPKIKLFYYFLILFDIILVLSSQSRLGIMCSLLSIVSFLFFYNRKYFYLVIALAIYALGYLKNRMDNLFFRRDFNALDAVLFRFKGEDSNGKNIESVRLKYFENFIDLVKNGENSFVGFSLENFLSRFGQYPHNLIIDILLEQGLFMGVVFFIYLIYLFLSGFKKALKNKYNSVFFQIAFISFFSSLLLTSYKQKLFWFIIIFLFLSTKNTVFDEK